MKPNLYVIPIIGGLLNCDSAIALVIFQRSLKIFHSAQLVEFNSFEDYYNGSTIKHSIDSDIEYYGLDREKVLEIYRTAFIRGNYIKRENKYPIMW